MSGTHDKTHELEALLLPDELLWADGGHASDVVLTALADGQKSIVPNLVRIHVERCTTCMSHLGNAALLSLHVDRELEAKATYERSLLTAKRPLPRLAIALGLAVAALGVLPRILDDSEVSSAHSFVTRQVPLLLKGLNTLARHLNEPGSAAGLFVTYAAAVMLVVMGIVVVRLLPKKETPR